MSGPDLCVTGDGRPAFWRQFCSTCCVDMGSLRRREIEIGARPSVRRQTIESLRMMHASVKDFKGGRHTGKVR